MCSDKSKVLYLIEEMQYHCNCDGEQFIQSEILLIHAVPMVNQIPKSSIIVTCKVSIC